jgi:hypothetical protein
MSLTNGLQELLQTAFLLMSRSICTSHPLSLNQLYRKDNPFDLAADYMVKKMNTMEYSIFVI